LSRASACAVSVGVTRTAVEALLGDAEGFAQKCDIGTLRYRPATDWPARGKVVTASSQHALSDIGAGLRARLHLQFRHATLLAVLKP